MIVYSNGRLCYFRKKVPALYKAWDRTRMAATCSAASPLDGERMVEVGNYGKIKISESLGSGEEVVYSGSAPF